MEQSGWSFESSPFAVYEGSSLIPAGEACRVPCGSEFVCSRPYGLAGPHLCAHPCLIGRPLISPCEGDQALLLLVGGGIGAAVTIVLLALYILTRLFIRCGFRVIQDRRARVEPVIHDEVELRVPVARIEDNAWGEEVPLE
uniref:WSC domain-containing protein n=1 Tax=Panagrellus redivivus TaxID=6233 RepID=A0A7E4VD66_PANRE